MLVEHLPVGLQEALEMTLSRLAPLSKQIVDLSNCLDRVLAEDLYAMVDSPSVDASLKDGYAVVSKDVAHASLENPVRLKITGQARAGGTNRNCIVSGTTIRILTGARIPDNANAVLSEEYVSLDNSGHILAANCAEPGRNILPKGSDVAKGHIIISKGTKLTPGKIGLIAAAGLCAAPVHQSPNVTIIATGDEVIIPGGKLTEGKLYASNLATLEAWCRRYGFRVHLAIVKDDPREILTALNTAIGCSDAVITSGGAWTGDRDLVVKMLNQLGWEKVFHRIRIGPGKAVGFGFLSGKPLFILPGGPPSNLMGFIQIALPGLLKLAGHHVLHLPTVELELAHPLTGRFKNWTQFVFGVIKNTHGHRQFAPIRTTSRLQSMADAQAIVAISEGVTQLNSGAVVSAQLLT